MKISYLKVELLEHGLVLGLENFVLPLQLLLLRLHFGNQDVEILDLLFPLLGALAALVGVEDVLFLLRGELLDTLKLGLDLLLVVLSALLLHDILLLELLVLAHEGLVLEAELRVLLGQLRTGLD